MSAPVGRYEAGEYDVEFGDDEWKAAQMARVLRRIPERTAITRYADVGCGSGGVFAGIRDRLVKDGFPIVRAVGYDVIPEEKFRAARPDLTFKRMQFGTDDEQFDLVTLNDVVEHVVAPQAFLGEVARRTRYVALHIPLDDRLSVLVANQYNFRLGPVGHISFWNPATALNLLTASGLTPIWCEFTPGFQAPSGGVRRVQRVARMFRRIMWRINPGLMAVTIGGASLAVVCRGSQE